MAQNPHERSQPSAILTYAHGLVALGRGRLSRSSSGTSTALHGDQLAALGRWSDERDTEPGDLVDLGQGGGQLVAVALGHAAGDDEAGTVAPALVERQHGVDRLLPGGLDEGARVDDDEVGVIGLVDRLQSVGEQRADQLVRVDLVLRTAQRLDVEALGHVGPGYLGRH